MPCLELCVNNIAKETDFQRRVSKYQNPLKVFQIHFGQAQNRKWVKGESHTEVVVEMSTEKCGKCGLLCAHTRRSSSDHAGMGLWAAWAREDVPAHGMKCSLKFLPAQTLLGLCVKGQTQISPQALTSRRLRRAALGSSGKISDKNQIVSSALFVVPISERGVTVGLERHGNSAEAGISKFYMGFNNYQRNSSGH